MKRKVKIEILFRLQMHECKIMSKVPNYNLKSNINSIYKIPQMALIRDEKKLLNIPCTHPCPERSWEVIEVSAARLPDSDMRIWEVIPRHSFMNLTRAFVSSTIDGPHHPKWHLKVTKSHFSCQRLFIEPWVQLRRQAGHTFHLDAFCFLTFVLFILLLLLRK